MINDMNDNQLISDPSTHVKRERFQQHVQEQKGTIKLTLCGPPRNVDTNINTNHTKKDWLFASGSFWTLVHTGGSRQDTPGTLVPLRRKAVGGPTTSHNTTRHNMNTDKSWVNCMRRNMCTLVVNLKSYRYTENTVPERSGSTSEELQGDPLHESTETENKKKVNAKKYKEIYRLPDWLQEFIENLVDESTSTESWGNPEQGSQDTSKSSHELPMEPRAKVELGSGKHRVYTHFPKDSKCDICKKTKITRASCRRRAETVVLRAEHFGDLITADHKVLSEESESRNNLRYAVVVQDLATRWIQSYPCKTKYSQETQKNLMKFLEPTRKARVTYTDNSLEFGRSCEELSWNHCTSTPHRSGTNGIAERAARRVKEGTSAVLLQSGLDNEWWADSMECYCNLRKIRDLLSDGKTPYERRFGVPFKGQVIPFGAMVDYHPISWKDQSRLHQFGAKVLPGIFLGYALGIWKGDILVADIEELEEMDAS